MFVFVFVIFVLFFYIKFAIHEIKSNKSRMYVKYMNSRNFVKNPYVIPDKPKMCNNVEQNDYTYVVDNTITQVNAHLRNR